MIIFDLHETLVSFTMDYTALRQRLRAEIPENFERIIETINRLSTHHRSKALALLDEFELNSLHDLQLLDNATAVLRKAREMQCKTCLITMQGRRVVEEILARLKISSMFDYVVTRDEISDRKLQIQSCLNYFRIVPQHVLVVGDKENDYRAAVSIGCRVFLVKAIPNIPYVKLNELPRMLWTA